MYQAEVLKDILLESGEIERYFDGNVPIDLWRAKKIKSSGPLFELVEREVARSRGAPRKPDITIENNWARIRDAPRGISTFDRPNIFKGHWAYYKIPAGTILPIGLAIVKDHYNQSFGATHYTIAPAHDMPLSKFKVLLAELAQLLEKDVANGN
ncbi:MAG: hypothetical protein WED00_16365 [Aquisalimonadaceae bacterium]